MGQKQSYSLNDTPHNKNAVEDEVAHTFNNTEPTPVSLKPTKSLRSSRASNGNTLISNEVNAETVIVTSTPLPLVTSIDTTEPVNVINNPPPIIYTLALDYELSQCIFVLDKENINVERDEQALINETISRLDGILTRHQELDELASKSEPLTISSDSRSMLECHSNELISEGIVVEEDDHEPSQDFSPIASIPVPHLPGDPHQTSIYQEHLLHRLPELA